MIDMNDKRVKKLYEILGRTEKIKARIIRLIEEEYHATDKE